MKTLYTCLVLLICLSFATVGLARKKDKTKPIVWKKLVERIIDTRDTLDEMGKVHHSEVGDTAFFKYLVDEVLNGNVKGYLYCNDDDIENIKFYSRVTRDSEEQFTRTYEDEYDSEKVTKLSRGKFPGIIDVYIEIIEEWTYNLRDRTTDVQIIAICPEKTIREKWDGDSISNRGTRHTFWIKWKSIEQSMAKYEIAHPRLNLQHYLFDDHHKCTIFPIDSAITLESSPIRLFHTGINKYFELENIALWGLSSEKLAVNLYELEGRTLFDELYNDVIDNVIPSFDINDKIFVKKLSPEGEKIWIQGGIIPETYDTPRRVINKDDGFDINKFVKYRVLSECEFDAENCNFHFEPKGLSPALDVYAKLDTGAVLDIIYHRLFWLRYNDIKPILDKYDKWHPLNNFSSNLWQSYFKPQPLKDF